MTTRKGIEIIGQSDVFLKFQEDLSHAASTDRPVLIIGERGTGKEMAAARLHYLSQRWDGPLVALNCAAMAPTLLDSELFGHEQGAFTGATTRREGRFEKADTGTLFLDEIANLSFEAQEKILRAVEYGEFERVGGSAAVEVDVRIIGATNADLPTLAEKGEFKRDLLDRLSFEVLTIPPLRHRNGDLALLTRHFATRMSIELGMPDTPNFTHSTYSQLTSYPWPGNVRELKNVIERAVYRSKGSEIDEITIDPFESPYRPVLQEPAERKTETLTTPSPAALGKPLKEAVRELELSYLANALRKARHNQRRAASLLGLTYHQFRGLYRKYADQVSND